jgi:small nuclear ribonucleoprotein (snRNP)-like protein
MDSLTITIIFIVLSTLIGAFIKGRMRDKCLLDFIGDLIHIELKDGKLIWGMLRLESTGLELKYREPYLDKADNHYENSYIIYKNEYPNILCVMRYVDDLVQKDRKRRESYLARLVQRKGLGGLKRRIRNFFATVRDSVVEVANLLLGRVKQVSPVSRVLSTQDKYVSQMQQGVFSSFNTSFEPLLEKHLGRKVILQFLRDGKKTEFVGVLKGYTAEFLELMDVDYRRNEQESRRKADLIVPRSVGFIRHVGQ